ncbi:hypothetical protein ACSBR1_015062 [Camellia fascicularis]
MASFVSSATLARTAPFCACGFGIHVVLGLASVMNLAKHQCLTLNNHLRTWSSTTWINPEHCLRHPKTCISGAIVSPTHSLYMCTKQFRTPAILGTCCQGVGIQLQEMCPYNDNARLLGCVQGLPGTYGQVPRGEATPKQIDKNVVKFKKKPLEHVELMRRVYEGATATGNFAWTPGADFNLMAMDDMPSLMDAEDCEDSSGLPPFQLAAHSEHTADDCAVSVEQTPTAESTK